MGIHSQVSTTTFVDAHRINHERYTHEREESQKLALELQAKGESVAGIEPEFWDGCIDGNNNAYEIYLHHEPQAKAAVLIRGLLDTISKIGPKVYLEGYDNTLKNWAKALEKNDPSVVVYW